MKILSIGSDRNLFLESSAVLDRIKEYAQLVEELHIVVVSEKSLGLKEKKIGENIWIYPTNSSFKFLYPFNAARLGKKIVFDRKFVRGQSVITTQDPFECGWAGLKVKNKWRIPLEVQLHTDPSSPYFSGFLNGVRKFIFNRVIRRADTIRVVGQKIAEDIVNNCKVDSKNVLVLPIYVDIKRLEEGGVKFDLHEKLGWQFILLMVSRLTTEKNIGMAMDVLKKVLPYFPDAGLVIVGAGPEEENLRKKAEELGIGHRVNFAGWQSDLYSYYHTANTFLQTSYFEGYGLSLVEAGLAGLPVVTTPVGIANELENGVDLFICPQGNVEFMFKAVYDLIENNAKRESLGFSIKNKLNKKLMSKEEYLNNIKKVWEETALKVNA